MALMGTPSCGGSLTAGTLTAAQYSASYSYDTLDRLTASPLGSYTYGDSAHLHAATAIGPSGGTATWTTSYDASGNTACRAATTATTCAGTTPTGALLTNDNEGRLTAWQNITSATGSTPALEEALYDGEGQRVQQIDESNTTHTTIQHTYVGGTEDIASQWANAGGAVTTTTTAYYASGLAQSVNGALSYTLGDGLGSVSASVNASGTVTASQLYGPYGGVRYQNGTLPTDYAFTHQRADATSGLDYYNARFYDPVAGQFASADTAQDGLNRYAYVHDNPETHTDPTGHCVPLCTMLAGLAVGLIIGVAVGINNHENAQAIFVDAMIGAGTGAIIGATLGAGLAAAGVGVAGEGAAAVAGVGAVGGAAAEEAEQELPPTVTDPTDIKDTDTIRTNMQYAKQLRGTTANGGFMKIRGRSELIWEGNTDGPDPIGGPNTAKYQGACVESRCATAATNLDNISEGDTVDIYYNHVNKKPMCGACLWNTQLAANRTGATFNVFGNNGRVYTFSPGGVLADLYPEKDVPYVRWASNSQISVWGLR